jgi:hypothetical protein
MQSNFTGTVRSVPLLSQTQMPTLEEIKRLDSVNAP